MRMDDRVDTRLGHVYFGMDWPFADSSDHAGGALNNSAFNVHDDHVRRGHPVHLDMGPGLDQELVGLAWDTGARMTARCRQTRSIQEPMR